MAPLWIVVTAVLTGCVAWMFHTARHTGPQVWPAWEMVLSAQARDRRRYEDHEADLSDELAGLRAVLKLAWREAAQGERDEAARALEVASRYMARHVPSLRERLELWRDAGRALSAYFPLPRLEVWSFRSWKLRWAAAGEGLARPVLDAAHRFSLRIYVLLAGLKMVLVDFRRTAKDELSADLERRLRRLEAMSQDLGTLHRAILDVYKALLISLHARGHTGRD